MAIFVGACMIEGTIVDGFKETLENYLLGALADAGHAYVVLFSLFLSYVKVCIHTSEPTPFRHGWTATLTCYLFPSTFTVVWSA